MNNHQFYNYLQGNIKPSYIKKGLVGYPVTLIIYYNLSVYLLSVARSITARVLRAHTAAETKRTDFVTKDYIP